MINEHLSKMKAHQNASIYPGNGIYPGNVGEQVGAAAFGQCGTQSAPPPPDAEIPAAVARLYHLCEVLQVKTGELARKLEPVLCVRPDSKGHDEATGGCTPLGSDLDRVVKQLAVVVETMHDLHSRIAL